MARSCSSNAGTVLVLRAVEDVTNCRKRDKSLVAGRCARTGLKAIAPDVESKADIVSGRFYEMNCTKGWIQMEPGKWKSGKQGQQATASICIQHYAGNYS
jgi:hypothetical protein